MATFISHSPAQTRALGEQWGRQASRGWLIGLSGELGAGKTILAAGVARGLGVTSRVLSPTFALVNEYRDGRLPLFHLDFYRLAARGDVTGAGLDLYLNKPNGVTVVEWIERWLEDGIWSAGPGVRFRKVEIKTEGDTERKIVYEDFGG